MRSGLEKQASESEPQYLVLLSCLKLALLGGRVLGLKEIQDKWLTEVPINITQADAGQLLQTIQYLCPPFPVQPNC